MSLPDLQRALDASLAGASPLSKRLFSRRGMDAGEVQKFVNRVMGATIATIGPDGRPHAALVLAACDDGTFIFTASPGSALLRNLRRLPDIALTVTAAEHDVTVRGSAEHLGQAAALDELLERLHSLSKRGRFTPPGWEGELYAVAVEKIFAS
ncbi:MAG TPA: pyridoxamine 5'-phosphate oxidase family protein [Acidimicrobiales bacterium]|nr:pyridoxamine 5'-phosphate oxidase family protein [Acidimicrobiales bacterium]